MTQKKGWGSTVMGWFIEQDGVNIVNAELMARAKVKEADRARQTSAYHMFEYGSAALQLAIVLAGAAIAWVLVRSCSRHMA